jgi:DMSO/TMAO reductase YedYZ molybdopterin-dependent catalytic subunit
MTKLRVEGEVATPRDFTFEELAALADQIEDVGLLVPGRVGGAVRLRSILAAVALSRQATHLTLESVDGSFSQSAPLEAVGEALVVYRLGDEPLPATQGGSIRFLIPNLEDCHVGGVDRCTNVKALGTIRIHRA